MDAEKEVLYLLLEELINESQSKKYNLAWLKDTIRSGNVNKTYQAKLEKYVTDFHEEWNKGCDRNILAEIIFKLLNCGDLIRMYEPQLPAGIKKSSMLTPEIRKDALDWADKVYKGLDRYTNFLDGFVKNQVFLNVILYQIATSKKSSQYKVALYCVKNKKQGRYK